MGTNYQLITDKIIKENIDKDRVPNLLLHACCAPCSSYCIEYLSQFFEITLFFYNPNISKKEEYDKRVLELERLVSVMNTKHPVKVVVGDYIPRDFYDTVKGLENEPEGGERCFKCYELRLREAAIMAKDNNYDYFTTTLSISPHKNAAKLNEIGKELSDKYKVDYLYSDFKKKNGYKRSVELSNEYGMYRQYYCGCVYSKAQRDKEIAVKAQEEKMN